MLRSLTISRDTRVNLLLGPGHFLSRFHHLCLLPLFIAWQQAFDVSFAELGLVMAVMSATAVLLQTPLGFFVDRYGARPFLVGGTLLMTLSMAAVGFATTYWQVVVLALLSGVGNSVFHPPDYAIVSGSTDATRPLFCLSHLHRQCRVWRRTAGDGGPDAAARLAGCLDLYRVSRSAGGGGDRLAKSHSDRPGAPLAEPSAKGPAWGRVAAEPIVADVFCVLHGLIDGRRRHPIRADHNPAPGARRDSPAASSAQAGYMVGQIGGVLVGGWVADRTDRHLPFVVALTIGAAALLLLVGIVSFAEAATIGVLFVAGLMTGASRTPRDVMVKAAAPPGQIGKVFGFVSSGMSLDGAIMPVPYGMIIDAGRPELVLVVVAALLLLSLLCAGGARFGFRRAAVPVAAE